MKTFEETKEMLTKGFSPVLKLYWESQYGKAEAEDKLSNNERSDIDRALYVQDVVIEFLRKSINESAED